MIDIPDIPMKSSVGKGGFQTRPYEDVLQEVREQHPEETPEQQEARALYRMEQHVDRRPHKDTPAAKTAPGLPWWLIAWGIAVLLLLGAIAAKAEPHVPRDDNAEVARRIPSRERGEPDERLRLIHRAMTVEAPEASGPQHPSGLILQLRNQGTVLTTRPAGLLILNCSTNMSCSMTGSTFNITSSSTASTAFSALTASLNTNVGTFSASGNSWDFTAATIFKLRAGAGLTASAAGDLGYDTTAGRWHGFIGAADRLFIGSTNVGTSGQAALSNADGTFTFADPIVSGPAAEGAAPVNNPVWVSGTGTDGFIRALRLFDLDSGAGAQWAQGVNLRKIASGGSVELGTATDPLRVDPTGTTTQPVSGTITANAGTGTFPVAGTVTANTGTGTFNNQQTNVTEDYDTGAGTQNVTKFGIALPASGGSVAGGTATNPVRTDPTGTTTQPVSGTVTANAGTGTFAVSGPLTDTQLRATPVPVSGTVTGNQGTAAAGSGAWPVAVTNTTDTVVKPGDSVNNAVRVNIVAGGGSGGTSATDNSVFTGGSTAVTPMGALFDTTPPAITDGNVGAPRMNSSRQLMVDCVSGCTAGGSFADASAFTFGTTAVSNMGAVVDDTATNTVAENSAGAPRMSASRVLYANPRDASGNEIASATAAPAGTERGLITRPIPSGTQTVAGTVTANIGTTGGLALDATVSAAQPRTVTGNVASGAADSGNPVKIGGVFNTTQPTVTTGQRVDAQFSARGETLIAKGVSGLSIDNTGFNVTGSLPAGTNVIGALSANQSVNVAQINGVTPLMGNGVTGTGSPRVTVASDNSNAAGIGGSATGSAVPSAARYVGGNASGNLTGAIFCDNWTNINQTAGAQLITGTASKQTYICNLFIYSATAQNVALVEGTGTVCATGIAGLMGGSTAATGQNLAANQGFVLPASMVPWRKTATAADNVCLLQSGTGQVSGVIAWTQF